MGWGLRFRVVGGIKLGVLQSFVNSKVRELCLEVSCHVTYLNLKP